MKVNTLIMEIIKKNEQELKELNRDGLLIDNWVKFINNPVNKRLIRKIELQYSLLRITEDMINNEVTL